MSTASGFGPRQHGWALTSGRPRAVGVSACHRVPCRWYLVLRRPRPSVYRLRSSVIGLLFRLDLNLDLSLVLSHPQPRVAPASRLLFARCDVSVEAKGSQRVPTFSWQVVLHRNVPDFPGCFLLLDFGPKSANTTMCKERHATHQAVTEVRVEYHAPAMSVRTLADQEVALGVHGFTLDRSDDRGRRVLAGDRPRQPVPRGDCSVPGAGRWRFSDRGR